MDLFSEIKNKNPDIQMIHINDEVFKEYGRVIHNLDCKELLDALEQKEIPKEGNIYVASDEKLEQLPIANQLQTEFYGGLPIQIGYCNGNSYQLNALEYHNCSELNIATTDIVLFLGKTSKIINGTYATKNIVAVYVPKGTLIELYGMTMHFAPCKTDEKGFKTIVVLLKGTNEDFCEKTMSVIQSYTLFKVNKWILAHPENKVLIKRGAHPGIIGENLQIQGIH